MRRAQAPLRYALAAAISMVALATLSSPAHAAPATTDATCSNTPRPDVTPPSVPGNARYTAGPMTTLSWEPSTDNTGVAQYQVFHRTTQIATTAETSITIPTPPPMVTTFGVRAVDAAGNTSMFAPIHFGRLPDAIPPTAPSNLRITAVCQHSLAVQWDPATDNTFVVGYELYIDGALITTVGGTRALIAEPIYPLTRVKRVRFVLKARDSASLASPPYSSPAFTIWPPR